MTGILDGLRIVEGSAFIAAPSGGMTLASLGADVIRFDPIGGGIDYQRWPVDRNGHSIYWRDLNKGKRSFTVDIRSARGKELVTALIAAPGPECGIFLTNFPARGWLAYETLRKQREDLIQISIQGDRHGGTNLDYTVNARVGLPFINGPAVSADDATPDSGAVHNSALPAWDLICGNNAVIGLLAAERHRTRTGQGQEIKLALADVAFAAVSNLGFIGETLLNGSPRTRHGNRVFGAWGSDFRCADGERLMVVAVSKRQWHTLISTLELGTAASQLAAARGFDFDDPGDRFRAHDEITAMLSPWFNTRSLAEAGAMLDAGGVCWGPYQDFASMLATDPDASTDNPMFNIVNQPDTGSYPAAGSPLDFTALDRVPARPAPRLGEHTDEILADCLGLSDSAIGELHDKNIVA